MLGSSGYMAPEQARGEAATPASDRYALACVAFELPTGRRPFVRDNPAAEANAHATETAPSPSQVDPSLPSALDAVFAGLAKRPGGAHASCAELVADLRRVHAVTPSAATTVVAAPASHRVATRHVSRPRHGRARRRTACSGAALAGRSWTGTEPTARPSC